ncbi:MAG: helix-turn-helix transcriptional regulator [Saprospiraceae bacterium]|nr:helix-turn-helix transcriptional regulator [Candidatus Vicinibacter proximus]MCC6841562.1 helix-turn-helix transcriptional regulator [Saprospiraceae bacterium]
MYKPSNYMRMYRKKSGLSQKDVKFLLEYIQDSSICRMEKGQRTPKIDVLLVYHLLFTTTVESHFELRSTMIEPILIQNCKNSVNHIKKETFNSRLNSIKIKSL